MVGLSASAAGVTDDVDGPSGPVQGRAEEVDSRPDGWRPHRMNQIARIGLDIAKRWFQIHAVDETGREVLNRKLPRENILGFLAALPACDVALEACSSS